MAVVACAMVMGLGLAFGDVQAAGLSAAQAGTVLGQPLDFAVQVRLDGGDTLNPECVSAEVHVSDQRLLPSGVRTVIEQQSPGQARVRVQTQQAIDEPVVSIALRVGCAAPISRRFVVFADPPHAAHLARTAASVATSAQPPTMAVAPAASEAVVGLDPTASAPTRLDSSKQGGIAVAPNRTTQTRSAQVPVRQARRTPASVGVTPALASSTQATLPGGQPARLPKAAAAAPRLTLEAAAPLPAVRPAAALDSAAPAAVAAQAAPSVQAESADLVDAALLAVAEAASATRAARAEAELSAQRIAALERTVATLRAEAQANQALAGALRDRLDRPAASEQWVWPLLATAIALGGLAAWLAWRLGRAQTAQQTRWEPQPTARRSAGPVGQADATEMAAGNDTRDATSGPAFLTSEPVPIGQRSGLGSVQNSTAPGSLMHPPAHLQNAPLGSRGNASAWPAVAQDWGSSTGPGSAAGAGLHTASTAAFAAAAKSSTQTARLGELPVRDVSIEELIDLEQQAEFFVVLGQDDAAVDLLVDHLRSTGGGSPLPYLKLLEIYSRTGDRGSYERNRARFNHRFNAYAPEWGSDLAHGRSLEDYPGILPRLEQVWSRPLDAMAELEALLFRKSRGELFDLPAYREVLFLYALARDLLDREAADTGSVDLLLPLTDGGDFGSTAPIPFMRDELLMADERLIDFDDPPTGPIDFDLTIPAQQTSMFDPLEETALPRRR